MMDREDSIMPTEKRKEQRTQKTAAHKKASTKALVLEALSDAKGSFISGETLSAGLSVSRAAVWKAISALREEGHIIKAVTNRGYMLTSSADPVTSGSIREFLPAHCRDIDIRLYDTIDSTNITARQLSAEGAKHGTTVVSLQQTAGKGRLGRSFFSPQGGLYLSIIIKPPCDMSKAPYATIAAAAATAEAIETVCGKDVGIKWVNDLYYSGKKICGILTEGVTDFESGAIESLVIGIGVNTSAGNFPQELRDTAGSIDGDYSRSELAAGIISRVLDFIENKEKSIFIKFYKQKSIVIGKPVTVYKGRYKVSPEDEIDGIPARAVDIDDEGHLLVEYADGRRESLSSGEISIRI